MEEQVRKKMTMKLHSIFTIVIVVVIIGIVLGFCISRVPPGYHSLVYNINSGLEERTLPPGWHWIWPTQRSILYPVSTEIVTYSDINLSTGDGKTIAGDITVTLSVQPDNLSSVFNKFRGQNIEQIEQGYLKSEVLRITNEVMTQYDLMNALSTGRESMNRTIYERLKESMDVCGITIETYAISGLSPDEATAQAIANVVAARNKLEQAGIERQTAEQEAQRKIVEARGAAEAARIEAEGQAAANDLLRQSLSTEVIVEHAIQKWDGELSKITGSGNLMLDVKELLEK